MHCLCQHFGWDLQMDHGKKKKSASLLFPWHYEFKTHARLVVHASRMQTVWSVNMLTRTKRFSHTRAIMWSSRCLCLRVFLGCRKASKIKVSCPQPNQTSLNQTWENQCELNMSPCHQDTPVMMETPKDPGQRWTGASSDLRSSQSTVTKLSDTLSPGWDCGSQFLVPLFWKDFHY